MTNLPIPLHRCPSLAFGLKPHISKRYIFGGYIWVCKSVMGLATGKSPKDAYDSWAVLNKIEE